MVPRNNKTNDQDGQMESPHTGRVLPLLIIISGLMIILFLIFIIPKTVTLDSIQGYSPVILTQDEKEWIIEHPIIRVCPDTSYPPFEMIDNAGQFQGISAELLQEIGKNTGLKVVTVHEPKFDMCVEDIKSCEADILGTVYISDLRKDYLIYSEPYYRSFLPIITRNTSNTGMTLEQYAGKRIASVKGYTNTLLLQKEYPEIVVVDVPDVKSGLEAVSLGTVDAFFGDLATSTYYVDILGISNLHIAGSYQSPIPDGFSYAFGIRKDYPELARILNKGLHAIPVEKRDEIFHRWISPSLSNSSISPFLVMIIASSIGFLLLITGFFVLWNRTLTRQVEKKTFELSKELEGHKKTSDILLMTRFTIDRSHAMIIWLDSEGIIKDINESVCRETGYVREELIGKEISILDSGLIRSEFTRVLTKIKTDGQITIESFIQTSEGHMVPVEVVLWHFIYEAADWFCAEIHNISERRIFEAEREAAIGQIQKNLAELSLLNDGIRNPLSIILGTAEISCENQYCAIEEQVIRIDGMIDQLDQRWNESVKILTYLKKHHGVVIPDTKDGEKGYPEK